MFPNKSIHQRGSTFPPNFGVSLNYYLPSPPVEALPSLASAAVSEASREVSEGYSWVEGPLTLNDTAI